jgi:hypothetical protein
VSDTGITATVNDRGLKKSTSVKIGKNQIFGHRCDLVLNNRAGKNQKDFLYEHEKNKKASASKITVYYGDFGNDNWFPIVILVRDTGIGDIKITMTKLSLH